MKYRKKELLDMIQLLYEANQSIKNMNENQIINNQHLFIECQTIAIEIGTYLENFGDVAKYAIQILEEYCENIYLQSQSHENVVYCHKICKFIHKQLNLVSNEIPKILEKQKKEIVFLPYKASMWDSLESIWMAASKDENCDVYVVAIPYFEKNSDGTLGNMIYEGEQYPSYVPITDWKEYNIQEHKPDIIYIHNPYDDSNYVTTIHPMFYSNELKKYTDLLVYVPYFVGIDHLIEEHLCINNGVLLSDYVIVESEEIKQIYINAWKNLAKDQQQVASILAGIEKKILPLGSPKLDRVHTILCNPVDVPKEWLNKIYTKDGKKKKVILYNTTIAALLNFTDTYIDKLRFVINTFQENPDIVLLWRPHPLLASTLQSMRVKLYKEYMEIVKQFQEKDIGIYDDTPDIERAIVFSDAYFGDMSSVVELYRATSKPILIQNCNIYTNEDIDK